MAWVFVVVTFLTGLMLVWFYWRPYATLDAAIFAIDNGGPLEQKEMSSLAKQAYGPGAQVANNAISLFYWKAVTEQGVPVQRINFAIVGYRGGHEIVFIAGQAWEISSIGGSRREMTDPEEEISLEILHAVLTALKKSKSERVS